VADVLSRMPNLKEENGILDQTTNVSLFLSQPMWLQEISKYLAIGKFPIHYNHEQKKKLALGALHFIF
jgi:hypothetical protein